MAGDDLFATDPSSARARRRGLDRQRELTILAVDLVGSTPIAEQLDPERWRDIILAYHDICDQAIARFGGSVGSRAGDGLMAHFGLPTPHEDDVRRATLAGLALMEGFNALSRRVEAADGVRLEARVGVHTGPVVITQIGDRREIVGSTANVASRVESVAEPGSVAISDVVRARLTDEFEIDDGRAAELRGVSQHVTIHTVLAHTARGPGRSPLTPLVGRTTQRDALIRLWERIEAGDHSAPRAAMIVGEAGLGKSRLAEQVANSIARTGAHRISIEHRAYDSSVPLHGFAATLSGMVAHSEPGEDLDDLAAQLSEIGAEDAAPALAQLLDLGAHHPGDDRPAPDRVHSQLMKGARRWISCAASAGGLVLVVEDLQWADPTTLELLGQLISRPPQGLMVLATTRPGVGVSWPEHTVLAVDLGPLSEDEIREWGAAVGDADRIDDERWGEVVTRSDGVPLYVDRLLTLASRDDMFWERAIPDGLDQLLTAIIETPGVDLRKIGILATIGRTFDVEFAATVLHDDERLLADELDALCELGVLDHVLGHRDAYSFHHSMVQTAAYEHQISSDRRHAHALVAEAIDDPHTTVRMESAQLAKHLDLGDRPAAAVPHYRRASYAAHQLGCNDEARRLAERGLELLDALPPDAPRDREELRLQMHLGLCITAKEGYGSADALACHQRAHELLEATNDKAHVIRVLTDLWSFYTIRGDRDRAAEVIANLRSRTATDPFGSLMTDQLEALHLFAKGELEASRDLYLRFIDGMGMPGAGEPSPEFSVASDPLITAYIQMGPICWLTGDHDAAFEWLDKAIDRSRNLGGSMGAFSEAYTMTYQVWLRVISGRASEALEIATEGADFSRRKGLAMWRGFLTVYQTICQARIEPSVEAEPLLAMMIEMQRASGVASMSSYFMTEHALLHDALGLPDEAVRRLGAAIAVADANTELMYLPETYRLRAGLRGRAGDTVTDAAEDLLDAATIAMKQGSTIFAVRALVDLVDLGEPDLCPGTVLVDLAELVGTITTPDRYPEVGRAREILGGDR